MMSRSAPNRSFHNWWLRMTTWSLPGVPSSAVKSRPSSIVKPIVVDQPGVIVDACTCSGRSPVARFTERPLQALRL